jgi:hypothetical protein
VEPPSEEGTVQLTFDHPCPDAALVASGAEGTLRLGSDAAGLATTGAVVGDEGGELAGAASGAVGEEPLFWFVGSVVVVVAPDSVTPGAIRVFPLARLPGEREWPAPAWTDGTVVSGLPAGPAAGIEGWVAAWAGCASVVSVVAS